TVVAPTLGSVANQTTVAKHSISFTLSSTDSLGDQVSYSVVDATTLGAPTSFDVSIDQGTGNVTLTPHSGFTGAENLLARVIAVDSPDEPANYTTQPFTSAVIALNPVGIQGAAEGAPVTFTLATSPSGSDVHFTIVDASTFAPPDHLTIVSIDDSTGQV